MACCCNSCKSKSTTASCLGRCDLPKHRCLDKEEVKPGPVPRHMGWMYCAKDSPEFQLKCGWRPGHISCPVLRKIEEHNGTREICAVCPSKCSTRPSCSRSCSRTCFYRTCSKVCSRPCIKPCFTPSVCSSPSCPPATPLIRIIRHGGQYQICTKPSSLNNSPSGPYPLKYVLDTEPSSPKDAKFSIEAKFNDYQFDYTSSRTSFILDFTPPSSGCAKPCPRKSIICMYGKCPNSWPPAGPAQSTTSTESTGNKSFIEIRSPSTQSEKVKVNKKQKVRKS